MKLRSLLIASLAGNAALLAWLALRPANPPVSVTPVALVAPTASTSLTATQANALKSGDPAQMKAAGVLAEVANILMAGRAYAKLQAMDQAQKKARIALPGYWRNSRYDQPPQTDEQRAAEEKASEEFNTAMERAFPGVVENEAAAERPFLSPAARAKLARIEKDYAEIEKEINSHTKSGVLLPSDTAKLKLLEEEKHRDIAAALSPAEFEELQLHDTNSETVQTIRSYYGDAIQSEADYRKIFALRKAYDDRYPFKGEADPTAREAAYVQLRSAILTVIGEENYAAFQRANDRSYKDLTAITQRLELPANTPDVVYAARDGYALQSQAINQNPSLTHAERRAQLTALGEKARADLLSRLGPEGAAVYTGHTEWLNLLKDGSAFSTNPKDAPDYSHAGTTIYRLSGPRPTPRPGN